MMRSVVLWAAAAAATVAVAVTGPLLPMAAQAQAQTAPALEGFSFASSGDPTFDAWRDQFSLKALAAGRDRATIRRMLEGLTPEPRIVTADQNQAEFVRPVWDYIERAVSARRIADGQARIAANQSVLAAVEARYGVDPAVIAGIWAIETNFGAAALPHDAARAIATLAAEGRRREQFERYMLALIEMVEKGYAGPGELRSSWAGAMGQPQFMPDVYLQLAVDFDGDGRRDIWTNPGDIFASIANYLDGRGWVRGAPVFDEVRLPRGFDYALADGSTRPIAIWRDLGIRTIDGDGLPDSVSSAQLFLPAGYRGPALLLYPNFAAIRAYNPSDRYALVVALLARGFRGEPLLQTAWPRSIGALDRGQMIALQQGLAQLGYSAGGADGMFGSNTRRAVRQYQQAKSLPADGYPTPALLQRITSEIGGDARAGAHANSPALDSDGVRALQRALTRAGYSVGRVDGRLGPATTAAIRTLEQRLRLPRTGAATAFILAEAEALPARPAAQPKRRRRR